MFKISNKKKIIVNLSASIIVLIINVLINMILSPIIVEKMGVEANGYVQLANNFLSYLTIISSALNSMSSRFITIELHKNNFKKAQTYYSSTFWGNVGILTILFIPLCILSFFLEHFIMIPTEMTLDVKLLFIFVFMNFYINTVTPDWNVATFSTNNLYLYSIGIMGMNISRIIVLFSLFLLFTTKMWYVSISMLISSIFLQIWTYYIKNKLLPDLKINKNNFDYKSLLELLTSGIWNSINQLGVILIQGLDLILGNLFVGPEGMGILSLAKIFPSLMGQLGQSIANVFLPNFTISFARNDIKSLVREIEQSSRICSFIMNSIFISFIIFGVSFFKLWVPSQNSELIQDLSILSNMGIIFASGMQPLWQVFPTVNKLKTNSIVVLLTGGLSMITTIIVLNFTDLGLYAICGISSFYTIIKNIFFVLPYSAKYLGLKKTTFIPMIFRSVVSVVGLYIVGIIYRSFVTTNSWISLFINASVFFIICIFINFFILLKTEERKIIINRIKII